MKQTKDTLRYLTIEETYELSEAIIEGDWPEMEVEVGDLMLHVLFYALLAEEKGEWSTASMFKSLTDKLIRRHPHIYGDVTAETSQEVIENWEEIKLREKGGKKKKVLSGVPKGLPALVKAMRIQEKVKNVGFDWEEPQQVWAKVKEELGEFEHEVQQLDAGETDNKEKLEGEFGDILFALVNYARHLDINPEDALEKTNRKFKRRFEYLEEKVEEQEKSLKAMSLAEMDVIWEEAKAQEKEA
ncbi:UNVERIFIED_CONTAM: hypothetical protein GTU68_033199 [Idotea baltica]|nr:hypothetical protein [Idotea baltica]